MDCPANVMLIPDDCGHTATPMANTMARQVAGSRSRPHFSIVAICVFLQAAMLEKPGCFGGNSLRAKKLSQVKRKHNGSVFAAVGVGAGAGRGAVVGAHCQVTTLSTAPCRIDLATGLSRQGFSECGLCSHQEEWFGIGKFQVSDVAWTSACGGRRGTVAPCRHQNLQAEALATNT